MKTLLTHITELSQEDWDYYLRENNRMDNPFLDSITHEDFIKKYFERGGKGGIFKKYFNVKKSFLDHSEHTNSIFFLGVLIYKNTKLTNLIFPENNPPDYLRFPFIWFLTCLFHDMGYDYEKQSDSDYKNKIWDIDSLKKELKINHDFSRKYTGEVPKTIIENISRYFIWKRFEETKIDHGIVAGYYIYDKLVKNRKYRYRKDRGNLFWGKNLDIDYAQAAAAIASHNIWFSNTDTEESYKKFRLDQLIGHAPINIEESPLLFLLGLVDSIDPIKILKRNGNHYTPKDILSNIKIEFTESSIKLKRGGDLLGKDEFKNLIRECEGIKSWLKVKIPDTTSGNSVEIKFD